MVGRKILHPWRPFARLVRGLVTVAQDESILRGQAFETELKQ